MPEKLWRTRVSKQHFKFETKIMPESCGRKWHKVEALMRCLHLNHLC